MKEFELGSNFEPFNPNEEDDIESMDSKIGDFLSSEDEIDSPKPKYKTRKRKKSKDIKGEATVWNPLRSKIILHTRLLLTKNYIQAKRSPKYISLLVMISIVIMGLIIMWQHLGDKF